MAQIDKIYVSPNAVLYGYNFAIRFNQGPIDLNQLQMTISHKMDNKNVIVAEPLFMTLEKWRELNNLVETLMAPQQISMAE